MATRVDTLLVATIFCARKTHRPPWFAELVVALRELARDHARLINRALFDLGQTTPLDFEIRRSLTPDERATVERRLAVCESSDWFWWLGDYNSPQSVACFDSLFRENLKSLYRLLHLPVPVSLDHPISQGGGSPESGGTMRRAN